MNELCNNGEPMRWVFFFTTIIFTTTVFANDCVKNRAVIEIGNYNTKFFQAVLNVCKNKINRVLLQKSTVLNFRENLENKRPLAFKKDILQKAESKIKETIKELKGKPDVIILANNLFKETTNGNEFLRKLKDGPSTKIIFVSTKTKAVLNFISAYTILGDSPSKYLVWDIGASGMNLTAFEKGVYHSHNDNLSSITFKNMVLNAIKKKTHLKKNSPNPLKEEGVRSSIELIRLYTRFELKKEFLELAKNRLLIGIGGPHTKTLKKLISNNKNFYSKEEIKIAIDRYSNKSDSDINTPSPDMQVTNLIMIYGQMLELRKENLLTINTNIINASILYPSFWE